MSANVVLMAEDRSRSAAEDRSGSATEGVVGDLVELATTANPAEAYLVSLRSAGSRDVMRRKLDALARQFGHTWDTIAWHELTFAHLEAIVTRELARVRPATVNGLLAALKGTLRMAWKMGQIDAESYNRIKDIKSVPGGSTAPAGRYVTVAEREALIAACQGGTDADQRDAALLLLLSAGGLRRAEVAAFDCENLEDDTGAEMMILWIHGKGRKERRIYLNDGARDGMLDWLAVRGSTPGAMFWSGHKGGHLHPEQRLTGQGVYDVVKRRARQARVRALTPHDLRRSWVSDLLDSGVDIATVALLAGHANVTTTQRYDRRGERRMKDAAQNLHFAYARRVPTVPTASAVP